MVLAVSNKLSKLLVRLSALSESRLGLGFLKYGTGVEERAGQQLGRLSLEQPKRLQSSDVDSIGSALTYAGEVVGEQGYTTRSRSWRGGVRVL